MYQQIMVPLDGSKFGEAALPLAVTLSRITSAPLHLVSVIEPVPTVAFEDWAPAAEKWTIEYLKRLVESIRDRAGGEVTSAVFRGPVAEGLQDEAVRKNADLVVMASHGRGAVSRFWLGSVADRFVRQTDRPVLLVKPAAEEGEAHSFDTAATFGSLLIPLDGSALSESALDHATAFGALFGAGYHLTQVVSAPQVGHTGQINVTLLDGIREQAADYLEDQAERMRDRGLRVTTSVTVDPQAAHGVLAEAEAVACDGIVMATHGRKGLSRALLGSTADKVLRGTPLPLLLYRAAE